MLFSGARDFAHGGLHIKTIDGHSYETKSDIYKERTQLSVVFPILSRKHIVEVFFLFILETRRTLRFITGDNDCTLECIRREKKLAGYLL